MKVVVQVTTEGHDYSMEGVEGVVGSYVEYAFPGERETSTTVQVTKIGLKVPCM